MGRATGVALGAAYFSVTDDPPLWFIAAAAAAVVLLYLPLPGRGAEWRGGRRRCGGRGVGRPPRVA
jgi:hypothetical protein